ncbi:MAG: GPW/gp25 family protein [Aquificae bacterium]|jgi:phage baseplate assembly protein W|nr:GPW/gp25 family protein [Aquificota bacterium]
MDIYLINGNFQIDGTGDLRILDERQTLIQDIYNRIRTVKGSHFHHPDYGIDLIEFLNSNPDELTLLDMANELQDEIEKDPRVLECEVEIEQELEGIKYIAYIVPIDDAPFSLEIDKQDIKVIAEAREIE